MKIILTYTGDDWWNVMLKDDNKTSLYSFVWPMVYHWLCEQIKPLPFFTQFLQLLRHKQ